MRRRLYAVRHTHGVGRVGRGARRVDTGAAAPAEYDRSFALTHGPGARRGAHAPPPPPPERSGRVVR